MADNLRDKAAEKYGEAKAKAADAVAKGKARAEDAAHQAKLKAEKAADTARKTAQQAAESARANAKKAAEATRSNAKAAAKKTAETVDHNPVAAIVGGLAVGAILAALLPRTQREDDLVGDVGRKVRSTASRAAKTAKDTAKDQLDSFGVNADTAKSQLRDIIGKIADAAASAGNAAADSVRKK